MRSKYWLLVILFWLTPADLVAQSHELSFQHQRLSTQTESGRDTLYTNNQLNGWVSVGERWGLWGFVYHERDYVSGVLGVFFDFTNWFELGLAAGAERVGTEETLPRVAGSLLLFGDAPCTLEGYYETGEDKESDWYSADLLCKPVQGFSFGIYSQTGMGTGPRFLMRLFKQVPLEVWWSPFMVDNEAKSSNSAVGIQMVLRGK